MKNDKIIKKIFQSYHFRKVFCTGFISITILFAVISLFFSVQNYRKLQKSLESQAAYTVSSLQEILAAVKNNAVFLGSLDSVQKMISSSTPTLDQLYRVTKDVDPYAALFQYTSICIYSNSSKRVYDTSGGMYYYDDFYDPELLTLVSDMPSNEIWLVGNNYTRYYAPRPSVQVVSYVHKLPLYETKQKGTVQISIPFKELQNTVRENAFSDSFQAAVSFQNHLIWSSLPEAEQNWDVSLDPAENEKILFPNSVASCGTSSDAGIKCTYYMTARQILSALLPDLRICFRIYSGAFLLLIVLSVLYTLPVLKKIQILRDKICAETGDENFVAGTDIFSFLDNAMENINRQTHDLNAIMEKNKPLIQERLIYSLLNGSADLKHLSSEYENNGIVLPYPYYFIILISLPGLNTISNNAYREQQWLLVRNAAVSSFSALGCAYAVYHENQDICILLNTKQNKELFPEISEICAALKAGLHKALNLYLLFSVSMCSEKNPNLFQTWQIARKNFVYKTEESSHFIQFGVQDEYVPTIPPVLVSSFVHCIIDKNLKLLQELTDTFYQSYLSDEAAFSYKQRLTTILMISVFTSLLELNADIDEAAISRFLQEIVKTTSAKECDTVIYACFANLIGTDKHISEEACGYVRTAIQYLKEHYSENISVTQIAAYVNVSSIYLNKIFKQSTEKTLSEYLNFYRISQSLTMLTTTNETIHKISESVGYSDVRSYIRFFKKFYDMTPNEYRKMNAQK